MVRYNCMILARSNAPVRSPKLLFPVGGLPQPPRRWRLPSVAALPEPMAEDDPTSDVDLLGVAGPGGLRGVLVPDLLDPPQPIDVADMDDNSANKQVENEFSQGADLRGCDIQGIENADKPSSWAESEGREAAEPGTVEALEALPAASGDFSAAALQQRVERMLVAGGDGPVRSGWPACPAQVTNELVLNAMQAECSPSFSRPTTSCISLPHATSLAAANAAAGSLAAVVTTALPAATALTTARRARALAAAIAAASLPSQRPRPRVALTAVAAVAASPPPSPPPSSLPHSEPLRRRRRRCRIPRRRRRRCAAHCAAARVQCACAMVGGCGCGGSVVSRGLAPLDRTLGVCV